MCGAAVLPGCLPKNDIGTGTDVLTFSRVGVSLLEGERWVNVSEAPRLDYLGAPAALVQDDGTAVVAWNLYSSIEVRRRVGGVWTAVGAPIPVTPTTYPSAVFTAMTVDAKGRLLLAWCKRGLAEGWEWNGTTWERLGSFIAESAGASFDGSIFIQSQGSMAPVIAWLEPDSESPPRSTLTVYRLNR